jgi:UDP-glucuronate 4-epimerase
MRCSTAAGPCAASTASSAAMRRATGGRRRARWPRGAEIMHVHAGVASDELALARAEAVIHLAALPGVRTPRPFATLWRENTRATERLARAAAERGARFVLASTSSVYGDAVHLPTPEDAPPSPLGPYAVSKLAAERSCLAAARELGADAVIVRLFTVYGPGQRPDMAFARWIRALATGQPVPWHARARTVRDFTYVDDAVTGLLAALDRGRSGQTYNVSGQDPVPLREALAVIERAVETTATLERLPAWSGEARVTAGCPRKSAAELGYAPRTTLAAGVERQVAASPRPRLGGRARARASLSRSGWESRAAARVLEWPRPAARPGAAPDPG